MNTYSPERTGKALPHHKEYQKTANLNTCVTKINMS